MFQKKLSYQKIRKKYLRFLKSQEVLSEPFRDKLGQLDDFFLPISKKIYKIFLKNRKTKIIGLTGGQGSGKSTISNILKIILKDGFNLNTVVFSIDDFYKTLKERRKMSKKISPLFLTRGVPGTHDTKLLFDSLKKFKNLKFNNFSIPRFDKSSDERHAKNKWQKIKKKPHLIIFEGWCVGARHQKNDDLEKSMNQIERKNDADFSWRKNVNYQLKYKYKKIFKKIDKLIYLKAPSFKDIFKWRLLQEQKMKLTSKSKKIMSKSQVKEFIMFYERITRHMMKDYSKISDLTIFLDKNHRSTKMKFY